MNEIEINAENLVNADSEEYPNAEVSYRLIEEKTTDHSRWSIWKEYIFLNKKSGKYYKFGRSVGATEMQDEDSWGEYGWDDVKGVEVVKKEVKIEKWVEV